MKNLRKKLIFFSPVLLTLPILIPYADLTTTYKQLGIRSIRTLDLEVLLEMSTMPPNRTKYPNLSSSLILQVIYKEKPLQQKENVHATKPNNNCHYKNTDSIMSDVSSSAERESTSPDDSEAGMLSARRFKKVMYFKIPKPPYFIIDLINQLLRHHQN